METGNSQWWHRHGWTLALLLSAFGIAFALRTIWSYPVIAQWGALYTYAGGSDSYYHSRVMAYIIQTHHNLVFDPMLKFPVGSINPREPLFDWMNAVLGIVFSPFFGGNAVNAGAWFLDLQAPLWAALQVFPIYLIGREVSSRRNGLIAALVYPFFSASIDTSTFGYADYQSFYTFFLLVALYSFLRLIKAVGTRRYVESYREPRQFIAGVRTFLRTERSAVKWAVFTGVAMGAFALSWQGYTYAIIIIVFTAIVAMLIERIRHIDSFGLYVSTWIIGLVAFPMAAPYYLVQHEIKVFLELPILLFFGALLLLLPFLLLRDVPWVFSIPTLVAVIGAGVLALRFLSPVLFTDAVTGDGYFVKNLIYSTVAEAQAPSIDALIVGYGVVTFFLAFAGLALFGYLLVRHRFKRYHIAFLIFAIVSIYLPISASKFFLVASPAFAILSAEGIHRLLDVGGYPQLRRAVASLSDRGGRATAFRKTFKARHVLVLALAVGILLPNIWIAIDAGIPSNTKDNFAAQVNDTIPSWLKLNKTGAADNYFGAAGTGLDTPNQYDSAAYNWLATQDTGTPEPQRPAFVSWWDYGFQAIDQGQHPSVADNFQNGIDPAGQFLLAQNQSLAIAVLATALLQAEMLSSHDPTLPPALNAILASDGVNVTALHQYLQNPAADYTLVVNNPDVYLPVDPGTLTDDNAMYLATSYFLADHLSAAQVALVYDNIEGYTGWSIRYAMTDTRLFPFTGSDTGIFYAPAELTGRVVNAEGVPTTFYNVSVLGTDGNTYPLGSLPADVGAVQYNINWSAPFYDSMLYSIYIGYNGTDAGQSGGIPGISGAAAGDAPEPGWMLSHFEVEYQTAYVCPGVANASSGASCYLPTNRPNAIAIANKTKGTANLTSLRYFEGGESILAYYSGVTLNGKVDLPDGSPVPGVRVTVYDGWNIPHMTAVTTANGTFSLVLPPGNDTLNITYGAFDKLNQSDSNLISSIKMPISDALGFSTNPVTIDQTFQVSNATVAGTVFWNVTGNSSYVPSSDPVVSGAQVTLTNAAGISSAPVTTDPSGTFLLRNVPPGAYAVSTRYGGHVYSGPTTNVSSGRIVNLSLALSPGTVSGTVHNATGGAYPDATVTLANASGVAASTLSSSTGAFSFKGLQPGGYTVSAVGVDPSLTSGRVPVVISAPGKSATANLTLGARGTAQVAVIAAGLTVPNASVTFTPYVSFINATASPVGSVFAASTNATLAIAGSTGIATASLAPGVYAVNAVARVGGGLFTGAGTVNVTGPGSTPTLTLTLAVSQPVTVTVPGTVSSSNETAVVAYGANGTQTVGWAGKNGSAMLSLPSGSYTFLALHGSPSAGAEALAGLATANVTGPTRVALPVGSSLAARFKVGALTSSGKVLPAPNATVVVSADPGGPTFRTIANASGSVGIVVPTDAAGTTGGYCLTVTAFGFTTGSACGYTAGELANLSSFHITVRPVAVTLRVLGLPAHTNVTVNFTGESLGAENISLSGPPSFALPLVPGVYGVGARAVIGDGTVVYLPSTELRTVIPFGATYSNLSLYVVPGINATGKLTVPSGLGLSQVTLVLASPTLNLTVNGKDYTTSFRATPANYTATVTALFDGVPYVNVTRITIEPNGTVRPTIGLTTAGFGVNVTLAKASGATVPLNGTLRLVTADGLAVPAKIASGVAAATLTPGTYRVYVNGTALTVGPNGTYYTNWTDGAGATCTFSVSATKCTVTVTGTVVTSTVRGTLVASGTSAPLAGTVRLVGPYPTTNLTVISAPNGSFAVPLLPGAYYLYATSNTGLSTFGRVLALPNAPPTITVPLSASWVASVRLAVANGSDSVSSANVTVRDAFGDIATFPAVSVGSTLFLQLPVGTYTISANGSGTLNGVPGTATASSTVILVSGNVAETLALAIPVRATIAGGVVGPPSQTVPDGHSVTFALSFRNSGNVPVTVRPTGAPSTWTFTFSFGPLTLQPGQNASGEVRIFVPNGTLVDHAPVNLTFLLPNGTRAGSISPPPTVVVLASYGLAAGTTPKAPPAVGPAQALLPFYLTNTGNTVEQVRLSVVDADRVAEYGWATSWVVKNGSVVRNVITVGAGTNLSVSLNLTANTTTPVSPGSVTVEATVVNASGITSLVTLSFPRPEVRTTPGTLGVFGPNVQGGPSPVPLWLVPLLAFVPTLALIGTVVTYRWWRTRRWTRR